jgi:hypothetical protein
MHMSTIPMHARPLAVHGLTSYRLKEAYGWIMIGAHNHADAMNEAARSTRDPKREALQVWDGSKYVDVDWIKATFLPATGEGENSV